MSVQLVAFVEGFSATVLRQLHSNAGITMVLCRWCIHSGIATEQYLMMYVPSAVQRLKWSLSVLVETLMKTE